MIPIDNLLRGKSREGRDPFHMGVPIRSSMKGLCATCVYASDDCDDQYNKFGDCGDGYRCVVECHGFERFPTLSDDRSVG